MDTEQFEKELLLNPDPDEKRYNILVSIVRANSRSNPSKSIAAAEEAIAIAEKLNNPELLAKIYNVKSSAHISKGEYDEAYALSEKEAEIWRSSGNKKGIAEALLNMGDACRNKADMKNAQKLLNESLSLFEEFGVISGIGRVYALLGSVKLMTSDYSDATKYYIDAINIFEETGDTSRIAGTISNLGGVYYFTGDYPRALEQYQKALTINEQTGNIMWAIANIGNIGNIYTDLGNYSRAIEYFEKSLTLAEQIEYSHGLLNTLSNIGTVYELMDEFEKALSFHERGLVVARELGNTRDIANEIQCIGRVYFGKSKFIESYEHFIESLALFEKTSSKADIALGLFHLSEWFFEVPDEVQKKLGFNPDDKYKTAYEYAKKSVKLSEDLNMPKESQTSLRLLSNIFEKQNNYKDALDSYKKYIEIRDTILGEESKKEITRKEMQYEFDKKETLARAEQEKKDALALKELQRQKFIRNTFVGGFSAVLVFAGIFFRQRNKIREGKKRSDELLLNILPEEVAEELKEKGSVEAKHFDEVTVMFTDFKEFTIVSERLSATELVSEIDLYFKAFDNIISKYNIEKIKTIGDSYMCAGGLPVASNDNAVEVVKAALEIQKFMIEHKKQRQSEGREVFEIRIGIHTGPVVAGIVGVKKFAYDIWGNTVNVASRIESSGEAGKINISGDTYAIVKDKFICKHRGKIEAKNKGMIDMYFVEGEL